MAGESKSRVTNVGEGGGRQVVGESETGVKVWVRDEEYMYE